jgi:hypothetical protein
MGVFASNSGPVETPPPNPVIDDDEDNVVLTEASAGPPKAEAAPVADGLADGLAAAPAKDPASSTPKKAKSDEPEAAAGGLGATLAGLAAGSDAGEDLKADPAAGSTDGSPDPVTGAGVAEVTTTEADAGLGGIDPNPAAAARAPTPPKAAVPDVKPNLIDEDQAISEMYRSLKVDPANPGVAAMIGAVVGAGVSLANEAAVRKTEAAKKLAEVESEIKSTQDQILRANAEAMAMAAATGKQGGGGFSLFGRKQSKIDNPVLTNLNERLSKLTAQQQTHQKAVDGTLLTAGKIFETRQRNAQQSAIQVKRSYDTLHEAVDRFNSVFSERGDSYLAAVSSFAAKKGMDTMTALGRINDPSVTGDPEIATLREMSRPVFNDPMVAKAYKDAQAAYRNFDGAMTSSRAHTDALAKTDGLDEGKFGARIQDGVDAMKPPEMLADHPDDIEKGETMKKQFEDLMKSIRELIEKLLSAIGIRKTP